MERVDWSAIGAMGEIIGALAVVVSLIYLGRQVREGARATRAETELEAARMWSEFHARVAHSADMATIWDRGHRDPTSLSEHEQQRFVWLVAEYFFLVEGLFKQRQLGFLSDDSWEQHERTLAGLLENQVVKEWWESGVSPYSREFIVHLDSVRAARIEEKWGYTALSDLGRSADPSLTDRRSDPASVPRAGDQARDRDPTPE